MTEHHEGEPLDILLVEDNPGDVRLTKEAFKEGYINNELHVVWDGEEALDFLFQRGDYPDAPSPNVVLLDLNLPKINGHEVLEAIRNDDDLNCLPVVVLTSSDAQEDIVESYERNSNAYITKPVTPDDFVDIVETFEDFWFTIVELPPEPERTDD